MSLGRSAPCLLAARHRASWPHGPGPLTRTALAAVVCDDRAGDAEGRNPRCASRIYSHAPARPCAVDARPFMKSSANQPPNLDLRATAAHTAIVLAVCAAAALAYLLVDILLLAFLGIVVAAALQPWHVLLRRWGVPKGWAVLLIYLVLLLGLVLVVLLVGPSLVDQLSSFVSEAPKSYAAARRHLQGSASGSLQFLGQRTPPLEKLAPALVEVAPGLFEGTLGVTASIVKLPLYFVSVLAIAFYWTLEVPRFERLLLSFLAVEKRPRALDTWRRIEARLGGFLRGQGMAMLFIGVASAAGYAQIGLPNVLALAVLAGLLEVIPWVGPTLAGVPALIVAIPLGASAIMQVLALATVLQLVESNVLIPRIMERAVGVSALIGLLATMAFGALYGIAGVFIAIPMAAVIQVLVDAMVVNVEPITETDGRPGSPWKHVGDRVQDVRQKARLRLRARASGVGVDPTESDDVEAASEQVEAAVAHVEHLLSAADTVEGPLSSGDRENFAETLRAAAVEVAEAIASVETIAPTDPAADVDDLHSATERFTKTVDELETLIGAASARTEPR